MVDLKTQYQNLKKELDADLLTTLENAHYILGPQVQRFESEAANYLGVKHAVGCANGTDALHLSMLAAGIGEGDELITTPFTFIATAEAIAYVNATPVFVDIDESTFNMDVHLVEQAITEKTKAILPVHLFGQPADMTALKTLADKHDLKLIEDCAQSFGARIEGDCTGSLGDMGCFSFFPSKNLGCFGDGGMVVTQSDELAQRLRMFRNHGSQVRYHHDEIGLNSRLDEIQAVVLNHKLPHVDDYNLNRRRVAHRYNELLSETGLHTPYEDGIGEHVYHQYTLLAPSHEQREAIVKHLPSKGIACAVYYPIPLHQQNAFSSAQSQSYSVSEDVSSRCLSLPIYPEMPDEYIVSVANAVKDAL